MKIGFCTDLYDGLFDIDSQLDCLICCGNFNPLYDKELITWNIVNQVDWINEKLNVWVEKHPNICFIFSSGPNDHIAKFYGSNLNFYLKANYIQDEAMIYKGIKIYSMPWLPVHHIGFEPSAFTVRDSSLYMAAVDSIPEDVDILLSWNHGYSNKNCKNIQDQGDIYLKKKIQSLKKLKIHAFGQYVEDNAIHASNSHLIVCSNRSHVGPYTIVEI